jgi:enamine deaminase RidA (YjgF/YER057c/UK114 family)
VLHLLMTGVAAYYSDMNGQSPAIASGSGGMPSCETVVEWSQILDEKSGVTARVSRFQGSGGVVEWNLTVSLTRHHADPVGVLERAWLSALEAEGIPPSSTMMRRVHCSDVVNQSRLLSSFANAYPGAFSCIGQTPCTGGKLALWSQHLLDLSVDLETRVDGPHFSCVRGPLIHHWSAGLRAATRDDSHGQTRQVLRDYQRWLLDHDMTLAGHVVRTWWFVRNIDTDYQGLVEARREYFSSHGLTKDTHYIASTGIAGAHAALEARLSLDSYAISGLQPGQVEYLAAPDHLGPTHEYGVTFERATAVSYADRRHVFISGTASIDPEGRVIHSGDVLRQLDRTMENVAALLASAQASFSDLAMIVVYLRDPTDSGIIEAALRHRLGLVPMVLVHAPVCRPGWLIEIEGVAIVPAHQPALPCF